MRVIQTSLKPHTVMPVIQTSLTTHTVLPVTQPAKPQNGRFNEHIRRGDHYFRCVGTRPFYFLWDLSAWSRLRCEDRRVFQLFAFFQWSDLARISTWSSQRRIRLTSLCVSVCFCLSVSLSLPLSLEFVSYMYDTGKHSKTRLHRHNTTSERKIRSFFGGLLH